MYKSPSFIDVNMFFLKDGILRYIHANFGACTTKCTTILRTGSTTKKDMTQKKVCSMQPLVLGLQTCVKAKIEKKNA